MQIVVLSLFSGAVWQILGQTSAFGIFILGVLVFMSLVSWAIIFRKYRLFKAVKYDNDTFLQHFKRSRSLIEAAGQAKTYKLSPMAKIYEAGLYELSDLKQRKNEAGGLQEKIVPLTTEDFEIVEMSMERSLTDEMGKLEQQVIFLATTGSSAPFLGLLGTVVGIMDSFWSVGQTGSASLAVVAPGIAEALLATIVGLGAAIPAVIAYNWANNSTKRINDRSYTFILDFVARARKEER
jgi:biopolymer transport protein TolQ